MSPARVALRGVRADLICPNQLAAALERTRRITEYGWPAPGGLAPLGRHGYLPDDARVPPSAAEQRYGNTKHTNDGQRAEKLGRKRYETELARLQGELDRLQEWVVCEGLKVCIVFEGRDAAGKGGVIKRITDRVSPRVFRVVALAKPTEREASQMHIQRYVQHFPAAGEVVIFDRSWYNRAGVDRVMGFCPEEEAFRFLRLAPFVEQAIVDSGILLLKRLARGRSERADAADQSPHR